METKCKYCMKDSKEELLSCSSCKGSCHPSCLELPSHIAPACKLYDWQCNDCKSCYACKDIANENQILFCDACDRGYHMYCITPRLKKKPKGDWYCPICVEQRKIQKVEKSKSPSEEKKESSEEEKMSESTQEDTEKKTVLEEDKLPDSQKLKPGRKSCPLGKKYSPNKTCPFPGCDGVGNVRPNSTIHFSVSQCPLSRDERKRERELLSMKEEPREVQLPMEIFDKENSEPCSSKTYTQTPVENIVSKTDIDMYNAAVTNSQELLALEKELSPCDGLKYIVFGDVEIEVWYKSQYPLEYTKLPRLFICEYCLEYVKTETIYKRHMAKCNTRHPPGDEIYRDGKLSVFQVKGNDATIYCQNLCLMAKLFLDHKTLWNDVGPFLFYIMTIADEKGTHIVGYFSKEKISFLNYNLSCILVMPHFMKMGYGRMLIDFSYLLSKVEGKIGSPERPLSDLGLISYRKVWAEKLLNYLMSFNEDELSIKGISESMAMSQNDIISTLQFLGMLKYWKGKHLILLKKEIIEEYAAKVKNRTDYKEINPKYLRWTPTAYK